MGKENILVSLILGGYLRSKFSNLLEIGFERKCKDGRRSSSPKRARKFLLNLYYEPFPRMQCNVS